MIHAFQFEDEYLLYDTESGSLHRIDELTYCIVKGDSTEKYSEEEVAQTRQELAQLKKKGWLDTPAVEIAPIQFTGEVKAMCLNVTHDCNLQCDYCFADEGAFHGEKMLMSPETGCKAVDFLIRHSGNRKNLEMDFFGGEPLMNFETVKAVVEYATCKAAEHGKVFRFTITTNGVLLNDEIADYINANMYNVVMSIDGRKETNDRIRKTKNGKGSYDLILPKFKKLIAKRGDKNYYVRGTFTHANPDFSKDVLHLNDEGIASLSVEPVVLPDTHPLALTDADIAQAKQEYRRLAHAYLQRRKNGQAFEFFHFYVNLQGGPCVRKRLTGCGAGNEYVAVAPDGMIYPCHQFVGDASYVMGNVYTDAWNQELQKKFADSCLLTKPECLQCWAKYHCSGGCAANNLHFTGSFDKPYSKACELMRARIECALGIYAKENFGEEDNAE